MESLTPETQVVKEATDRLCDKVKERGALARLELVRDGVLGLAQGVAALAVERNLAHAQVGATEVEGKVRASLGAVRNMLHIGRDHRPVKHATRDQHDVGAEHDAGHATALAGGLRARDREHKTHMKDFIVSTVATVSRPFLYSHTNLSVISCSLAESRWKSSSSCSSAEASGLEMSTDGLKGSRYEGDW